MKRIHCETQGRKHFITVQIAAQSYRVSIVNYAGNVMQKDSKKQEAASLM